MSLEKYRFCVSINEKATAVCLCKSAPNIGEAMNMFNVFTLICNCKSKCGAIYIKYS